MRRSSSLPERGSALLEVLVLGAAAVVATVSIVMTANSIMAAGDAAREAARTGAIWGSRHGDADLALRTAARLAPVGSVTTARRQGDHISVIVRTPARLARPFAGAITDRQIGRATVPIAPYRSNR
jgi:uncharacterized Rossmann fold enzyme